MAFVTPKVRTATESKFRKTKFIALPTNTTSSIRILDEVATDSFYHYIGRYSVKCLASDCPVCESNREIYMSEPEEFRKNPSYFGRRTRYFVNVFDKTLAKKCESCGIDVKETNLVMCPKCQTSIATVIPQPINEVRVLSKGPQLFEDQLSVLDGSVTGMDGEPLGITGFDINLVIRGTGKDTVTTAIPNVASTAPVVLSDEDELYDLSEALIILQPSEMLELVSGVSLRDIFVARGGSEPQEAHSQTAKTATFTGESVPGSETTAGEIGRDVSAAINDLFGEGTKDAKSEEDILKELYG